MIYHHKGYPKIIVDAIKRLASQQKTISDLRQVAQDVEDVIEHFTPGTNLHATVWAKYHKQVYMFGEVETMEQVAQILRELSKRGYTQTAKTVEEPKENKREYFLGKIRFEVQLKGTVCRYVKVGEEIVIKDVFELRCDEEEQKDKDKAA